MGSPKGDHTAPPPERGATVQPPAHRTPSWSRSHLRGTCAAAGFGPHRIAWALGLARSTVYAVLRRFGLSRLDQLHRVSRRKHTKSCATSTPLPVICCTST